MPKNSGSSASSALSLHRVSKSGRPVQKTNLKNSKVEGTQRVPNLGKGAGFRSAKSKNSELSLPAISGLDLRSTRCKPEGTRSKPELIMASSSKASCPSWEQAAGWLSAISQGVLESRVTKDDVPTLQKCLLACSSITRTINETLECVPGQSTALQSAKRKESSVFAAVFPKKKFQIWGASSVKNHSKADKKFRWKCRSYR